MLAGRGDSAIDPLLQRTQRVLPEVYQRGRDRKPRVREVYVLHLHRQHPDQPAPEILFPLEALVDRLTEVVEFLVLLAQSGSQLRLLVGQSADVRGQLGAATVQRNACAFRFPPLGRKVGLDPDQCVALPAMQLRFLLGAR